MNPRSSGVVDVVFRASRVVTLDGERPATIHVGAGIITAIGDYHDVPAGVHVIDAADGALLPGLVDTHVHINDPGRADWEGFETGSAAAAAGGVTTLVDMPLNCIPSTTTVPALEAKRDAARTRARVDVAFWGGLVPGHLDDLSPLVDAGAAGFKCFLVPTATNEFEYVRETHLREGMRRIAQLGVPLLAHAELPGPIEAARPDRSANPRHYATYQAARPVAAETTAVELLIGLARETGARVHVVHVAAAEVVPLLRVARREGLPITAETCPHYLHFSAEEVPDGATAFKCAPPIRDASNRERLWTALASGDLDMIVSDHSPCPPEWKRDDGDFLRAWGGIASLQLGLAIVWTNARPRGFGLADVAAWMSTAPARLAGLLGRKGAIAPGYDADIALFRPDTEWTVDPARLHHRHPVTPYAGCALRGVVEATWLRGEKVHEHGRMLGACRGRMLAHETTAWTSPS